MKKILSLAIMWVVALNAFATFVCTFDPAVDRDISGNEGIGSYELQKTASQSRLMVAA